MLDIETERQNLATAERHVAEGEERIRRQVELIERLRADAHGVFEAESLLVTLQQTLQSWRDHRDEIVRTIARLEAGAL